MQIALGSTPPKSIEQEVNYLSIDVMRIIRNETGHKH